MLTLSIYTPAMFTLFLSALLFLSCETHTITAIDGADGTGSRAGDVRPAADYEVALTDILRQVVTEDGLVRYDLLRGTLNEDFRRVLKAIEDYNTDQLQTHRQQLAFWINAYNVQMLQNIIETVHITNIVEDGFSDAFFKMPFLTAGQQISLDQLENTILRQQSGPAELSSLKLDRLDPRIHVALNCAAISCPRLRKRAFTAENVDTELDAAMRDFAAGQQHFRVEGDQFVLSSLLDWFGSDFDQPGAAGDYVLQFMPTSRPNYNELKSLLKGRSSAQIKAQPKVTYEYLWKVNAAS